MNVNFDDDNQANAAKQEEVAPIVAGHAGDAPKKLDFKLPKISIPAIRLPAISNMDWRKAALVLAAIIGIGMAGLGAWLFANKQKAIKPPVMPAAQVQPQVTPEPAKPVQAEPVQIAPATAPEPEPVAAPTPTKTEKTPEQLAVERKARLNRQLSGLLHQTR